MALAFTLTLLAFWCVFYACLAIFNNPQIIPFSHWGSGVSYPGTFPPRGFDFFAVFIGLRGYVLVDCKARTEPDGQVAVGFLNDDFFDCTNTGERGKGRGGEVGLSCAVTNSPQLITPNSSLLSSLFPPSSVYSFSDKLHSSWSGQCRPACAASIITAFSGLYGLFIAMVGTLNRMRPASDAPQQKMMGSVFDTIGSVR